MSLTTSNRHSGMFMALACTMHPVHSAGELWRGEAVRFEMYDRRKSRKPCATLWVDTVQQINPPGMP